MARETKELEILEVIDELQPKAIDGEVPLNAIFKRVDSPKESIRTILSKLKRVYGYVDNPTWGHYIITDEGKAFLEKRTS